jgi:uncharacterized protein with von Willebrand factor type A (vWA) domain
MDRDSIYKDKIDRKAWTDLLEKCRALREKARGELQGDLLADAHASLLKPSPMFKPVSEIAPSRMPVHTVIDEMLRTSDWRRLHAVTQNDPLGAGMGTLSLADHLIEALREFGDAEELARMEKQIDQLRRLAETLEEMNLPAMEQRKQEKDLEQKISACEKRLREKAESCRDAIRLIARKACRKAAEEVEQVVESVTAWGTEPGKPASMDLSKSLDLARRLMTDQKLQRIARLAGRMRSIALAKRESRAKRAPAEIVDIECGNDLGRVLPGELMLLHSPLKLDFLRRFTESSLMQHKMQGSEKQGKGPVIVCLDESGSMAGDKEIWSKAFFLGFHALAAKDRRDIAYLPFGTEVTRCEMFRHGQADPLALCDLLTHFAGHGGTNFDAPLEESLSILDKSMPNADIVFITDGVARVSDCIRQRIQTARQAGLHLYVVLIGGSGKAFEGIADLAVDIAISEDGSATDIFGLV